MKNLEEAFESELAKLLVALNNDLPTLQKLVEFLTLFKRLHKPPETFVDLFGQLDTGE